MLGERIGVLVAAGGAAWEVEALRVVGAPSAGAVMLKRCVDLPDLLATASTGQARVAVVSSGLPGLDADSLALLRTAGVGVVVVAEPGAPATVAELPGVAELLDEADVGTLAAVLPSAAAQPGGAQAGGTQCDGRGRGTALRAAGGPMTAAVPGAGPRAESGAVDGIEPGAEPGAGSWPLVEQEGRVVAVWGPAGAPGRTTVAVGLASGLARAGHEVLLVDADPYGGAVAQHLGVLDEVSGLLSAVRLANTGQLDVARLAAVARTVSPGLRVLTGLPRADRWAEVRGVAFDGVLEAARGLCSFVVLDLGFAVEQSDQAFGSSAPQRNLMTVAGLDHADETLVVGSADPVGLARLARGLVELPEVAPAAVTRVAVNRVRSSLGWGEVEVRAMVEGFVTPASMHFLPHDLVAADRALMAGRPVPEVGDSALGSELGRLAHTIGGAHPAVDRPGRGRETAAGGGVRRFRRRRAGRAR